MSPTDRTDRTAPGAEDTRSTSSTRAVTPRSPGEPEPDLRLYHLVHVAMSKTLAELTAVAERMERAGRADADQARAFQRYTGLVMDEIERHHRGEDNVGWPLIVASAGQAVDLAPLSGDHAELDPLLHHVRALTDALVANSSSHLVVTDLAVALRDVRDLLVEHIEEEERDIFPVIRTYVSRADHQAWEDEMKKELPLRDLWFVVSWVASAADPAERGPLLKQAGLPFRIVHTLSKNRYERLRVRATRVVA